MDRQGIPLEPAQPALAPGAGARRRAGTHVAGAGTFLPAFEPLLDSEDPWVRALARLQLGKMRIMLGEGGRDADAYSSWRSLSSGRSANGGGFRSP